jgi:hypothetical protein
MAVKTLVRKLTRRGAWLVAILALVLVLVLAACGRGGNGGSGGYGGTDSTGGTSQVQTSSSSTDAVIQSDNDLDDIMATLDSANIDANIDLSSQDNASAVP